jgi:hypothetical protein
VKLLRTLRLDRSDTFVFERAAEPGEWAVPGAFMFWDAGPATLAGKARAAFRSGFLGTATQGWSTLAEVAEASEAERAAAVAALAASIHEQLGAPDLAAATAAAEEEFTFAASLCDHPAGTVIALQRGLDDAGEIRERFRTLKPTLQPEGNSFAQGCVLPIGVAREDGETGGESDQLVIEEVDFIGMMGGTTGSNGKDRT